MRPDSPYSLIKEMLETPGVLRNFDERASSPWAAAVSKNLMVTGEGSSRIFPAKNLIARGLATGHPWRIVTEGARQAAEYDLGSFTVIGSSNSGRTRELMDLMRTLPTPRRAVTATPGSPLALLVEQPRVLGCGVEAAVPATKSVFEQALVFQSLLQGREWKHKSQAADLCAEVLAQDVPAGIAETLAQSPVIYFAGRNDGVAEELTLKSNEIARKKAVFLEGTYALHGVEEVMQPGETVVLVEPFAVEADNYKKFLASGAGVNVVAISTAATPFPTLQIPLLDGFDGYLRLLAGWNLLAATGIAAGVDIDKPARARKVGNSI